MKWLSFAQEFHKFYVIRLPSHSGYILAGSISSFPYILAGSISSFPYILAGSISSFPYILAGSISSFPYILAGSISSFPYILAGSISSFPYILLDQIILLRCVFCSLYFGTVVGVKVVILPIWQFICAMRDTALTIEWH